MLKKWKEFIINEAVEHVIDDPIPMIDIVSGLQNGNVKIELNLPDNLFDGYPHIDAKVEHWKERIIDNLMRKITRYTERANDSDDDNRRNYYLTSLEIDILPYTLFDTYVCPITGHEYWMAVIDKNTISPILLDYDSDPLKYEIHKPPQVWGTEVNAEIDITNGFMCIGGDSATDKVAKEYYDRKEGGRFSYASRKDDYNFHYSYLGKINLVNYFSEKENIFFIPGALWSKGIYKRENSYIIADEYPTDDNRMKKEDVPIKLGELLDLGRNMIDADHSTVLCDISKLKDVKEEDYMKIPVENGRYKIHWYSHGEKIDRVEIGLRFEKI